MKEYKPVDAAYEDIYDFSEINGKYDTRQSFGKSCNIDEYCHIVRPTYRPKVNDDRVRLPPVVIGNSRMCMAPTNRPGLKKSSAELWNRDLDRNRERKILHENVAQNIRQANADLDKYVRKEYRPLKPESVDRNEIYSSLMEGVHDVSMLEKSPQVQEYQRRNKIKPQTNLTQLKSHGNHALNQGQPDGDVFMKRVNEYEERIKRKPRFSKEFDCSIPNSCQESVYQPAPPTAPKPSDNPSFYRNRWSRYNKSHK